MTAPLHERLAEAAKAATPGDWSLAMVEYRRGTNLRYTVGSVKGPCGIVEVSPDDGRYIEAAQPRNVAKLCEQVRVLLGAVKAVEDFISGKPDAPEPFGMTRDALRLVKGEQ